MSQGSTSRTCPAILDAETGMAQPGDFHVVLPIFGGHSGRAAPEIKEAWAMNWTAQGRQLLRADRPVLLGRAGQCGEQPCLHHRGAGGLGHAGRQARSGRTGAGRHPSHDRGRLVPVPHLCDRLGVDAGRAADRGVHPGLYLPGNYPVSSALPGCWAAGRWWPSFPMPPP